jgi:hypothetical protein
MNGTVVVNVDVKVVVTVVVVHTAVRMSLTAVPVVFRKGSDGLLT